MMKITVKCRVFLSLEERRRKKRRSNSLVWDQDLFSFPGQLGFVYSFFSENKLQNACRPSVTLKNIACNMSDINRKAE